MVKPAFARLPFGDWSRILVGQINRKHYFLVVDEHNKVLGFAGWALASEPHAEAWLEQGRPLTYAESLGGDCILINAWSAETGRVHRFLVEEVRKVIQGKKTVYYRRHYKTGRMRTVRLPVNDFVAAHVRALKS